MKTLLIKTPNSGVSAWRYSNNKGFTLVELMVTIAVLAILLGIAFPSMKSSIASNRVYSQGQDIVNILNFARSEAISRGAAVTVSPQDTWTTGVLVKIGTVTIKNLPAFDGGTTISNGADITFTERGHLANTAVTLQVSHSDTTNISSVSVATGGSISRQ